jgi:hypothetical protein
MELESLLTGAGGVAGVCAWVIVRQARLIDDLRADLRAQQDASREQMEGIYSRLLEAMSDLQGALGAMEKAIITLGMRRGKHGEGSNGAQG